MFIHAHDGHEKLDIERNSYKPYELMSIINEDVFEFERLQYIRYHGKQIFLDAYSNFIIEGVEEHQKIIFLEYAKNIYSFHDFDKSKKTFIKNEYEKLFQVNPLPLYAEGLMIFGDEKSLSLLESVDSNNNDNLYKRFIDNLSQNLDKKYDIEKSFASTRSQKQQDFLFCCLALTGGNSKEKILEHIKNTLNGDDVLLGIKMARDNELNLRPVIIKLCSIILEDVPEDHNSWKEMYSFINEFEKSNNKYTNRSIDDIFNKFYLGKVENQENNKYLNRVKNNNLNSNKNKTNQIYYYALFVVTLILLGYVFLKKCNYLSR